MLKQQYEYALEKSKSEVERLEQKLHHQSEEHKLEEERWKRQLEEIEVRHQRSLEDIDGRVKGIVQSKNQELMELRDRLAEAEVARRELQTLLDRQRQELLS